MSSERREIVHHAVIGALVAVGLSWFDQSAHLWFQAAFAQHPNWWSAATYFCIGLVAFWLIAAIEASWHKEEVKERKLAAMQPVRLEAVGEIDGHWIDVVFVGDEKTAREVSLIEVSSGNGKFTVSGSAYRVSRVGTFKTLKHQKVDGDWVAEGAAFGKSEVYYHYDGSVDNDPDRGVGFYQFHRDATAPSEAVRYKGTFIGVDHEVRHTVGRKLSQVELDAIKKRDDIKVLSSYIEMHGHLD